MQTIFPATAARLEEWKTDRSVVGVILVGSKSRGYNDEFSDDDLEVLLAEEAFVRRAPADIGELFFEEANGQRRLIFDVEYTSLDDLRRKAGSPIDLDRWPYERAAVLFDRAGEVTQAVSAAGAMDADFRQKRLLHATVDAWSIPYRAIKTRRRGFDGATRLLIARGARALTRLIFALEWRWVPLDHWLERELVTLRDPEQTGPALIEALKTADPAPLIEALNRLEDRLWAEGVPRHAERHTLFYELIHPARAGERAIHGLF